MRPQVLIINKSKNPNPERVDESSSGYDIRSNEELTINPGERALVHTGIYLSIPPTFEAQVRPRSGLALKYGITVLNTPGTIDSSYQGEIGVILINLGHDDFKVEVGDRIAQLVFASVGRVDFIKTEDFPCKTDRGSGGFGHTGIK